MDVIWITFGEIYKDSFGNLTSNLASFRYRVAASLPEIQTCNYRTKIIAAENLTEEQISEVTAGDIVIFSKSFLKSNETLIKKAKTAGATTIFDVCDNHYESSPFSNHYQVMSSLADMIVCNTESMAKIASRYCPRPPIIIPDPYEGPQGSFTALSDNLHLLWFGHPSNLDSLQGCTVDLIEYAKTQPVFLHVLTQPSAQIDSAFEAINRRYGPHFRIEFQPWSLDGQWKALAACDVVIIPSLQNERKQVKSANRMIEALWAGKPVVAQPMPAYTPFGRWTPIRSMISEGLAQLMSEREMIPDRILAAQAFIEAHYSPSVIGKQWKALIDQQARKGARQ